MIDKPRPKKAATIVGKRNGPKRQKPKREVLLKENRPTETQETRSKEKPLMSSEPKAPAAADRPQAQPQTQAQIRYVDRADMGETFADSISGLIFDGQTLRIEFSVTRFDEVKTNTPITGRRYPACRLVLPPAAAVDLINRMQQIAAALTQAGVVKPAAPRAAAAKAD
ncbi:MAG TPA: hypothetical protein VH206_24005 [Xanthobacteraceae bacterium]|jgi:hypothetical protein|nr:hypothetical protein [Xanthobacteraceae bacterium]